MHVLLCHLHQSFFYIYISHYLQSQTFTIPLSELLWYLIPQAWNHWLSSNLCSKQFCNSTIFLYIYAHLVLLIFCVDFDFLQLKIMPQRMAVTHADLEPSRRRTDLSSKTGAFLVVVTILIGLFCFILCLIAEATRSEVQNSVLSIFFSLLSYD